MSGCILDRGISWDSPFRLQVQRDMFIHPLFVHVDESGVDILVVTGTTSVQGLIQTFHLSSDVGLKGKLE